MGWYPALVLVKAGFERVGGWWVLEVGWGGFPLGGGNDGGKGGGNDGGRGRE